ncbi:hypothetical protein SmJEL517_g02444 [Synchytrium microbalum]|uniref:Short chain dehydrogenase n=1 Tax=Synchytrium microbalum TaxID=1806994 RepID=A0A507CBT3_9FUNG|nr:uncharacterized protein SmJEL517_g02444 [Synchytrium microbalum]TPX35025.1 hypothetical protein SmJEL517_g02444 [Synchytrium microbalum]
MVRKVAIVIGASRGMGADMALALAKEKYHVVVTAKSQGAVAGYGKETKLKGKKIRTVDDVAAEITAAGGTADAVQVDVRKVESIDEMVKKVVAMHGRVDVLIYNAGAIWWAPVKETNNKRFELMQEVNVRGYYAAVQAVYPHMIKQKSGRIIGVSPPIYSRFFRGKTSYAVGKVGMSVLTMGLAFELEGSDIAVTSIWPATAIQSAVTEIRSGTNMESLKHLRKASIFSDAIVGILSEPAEKVNGLCVIDEDFLRDFKGVTDFSKYQVVPGFEPARSLPKKFPSLLVAEQADRGRPVTSVAPSKL